MGLYAALYFSEALNFDQGLLLIKNAYECSLKVLKNNEFIESSSVSFD